MKIPKICLPQSKHLGKFKELKWLLIWLCCLKKKKKKSHHSNETVLTYLIIILWCILLYMKRVIQDPIFTQTHNDLWCLALITGFSTCMVIDVVSVCTEYALKVNFAQSGINLSDGTVFDVFHNCVYIRLAFKYMTSALCPEHTPRMNTNGVCTFLFGH